MDGALLSYQTWVKRGPYAVSEYSTFGGRKGLAIDNFILFQLAELLDEPLPGYSGPAAGATLRNCPGKQIDNQLVEIVINVGTSYDPRFQYAGGAMARRLQVRTVGSLKRPDWLLRVVKNHGDPARHVLQYLSSEAIGQITNDNPSDLGSTGHRLSSA